jgi:hypothetical protein
MYGPSFGPVLLASPSLTVLDWALVGVALVLGYMISIPPHPYYQPLCVGAAVFAISRDFDIPFDAALMACLPICLVRWDSGALVPWTLLAAIVVNYFLAVPAPPVPTNPYTPAVAAFLFVARAPSQNLHKLARVGLVVARFREPRCVHAMYGGLFYLLEPVDVPLYDREMGAALAYALCALLAREEWYHVAVAAVGAAVALLQLRLPRMPRI